MTKPVLTLSEALSRAISAYNSGNLLAAEQLCRQIVNAKPDLFDALHLLAIVQSRLGKKDLALASFDRALAVRPDHADALSNRGLALHALKRFTEALASYDRALQLRPGFAEVLYNRGATLRELKRREEALASYQRALAARPDFAGAHFNCGVTLHELMRFAEALASYDRALKVRPDHAETHFNRGLALHELKRFDGALESYDRALALRPDYVEALCNRGVTLHELARFAEALASYDRALALRPDHAEAHSNRGLTLHELMRFAEALASYDRALALRPDYAEAHFNRGVTLHELARFAEALASYDRALALRPDYAEAHFNRGVTLHELARFAEALASYDRALAVRADYAEALSNRGGTLRELMRLEEAAASYEQALALKPDFAKAEFALCMAELPILYMDEADIVARRTAYEWRLRALCAAADDGTRLAELAEGVGSSQPFFLAYQGCNDRDLQALYGSFVCRIMAKRYPPAALAPPPKETEPVRVGIVSGFFRQHSNWKIPIKGWISQLDRRRFQVFGYHTGVRQDAETAAAAALCDRFVQGPKSIEDWRAELLADAPHVLIYPEVGMDPVAAMLAAQRLAAVQCNSWGHPDSSGFPTLDYYLSSDLMEPANGQDHYTERLVRLPNLSVYCEPIAPPPPAVARQDLGLRSAAIVYWCCQSLFKYLPQFDEVFPRIARAAGDCQFAFIHYHRGSHITELFRRRLDRAFGALGLDADAYCRFLPPLDWDKFVAASGQCDVFLDSINWSGCNSTLESLLYDLPIVTMAGPLMRARHSAAILTLMGVSETIAATIDDYVSIAVRLARDAPWRMAVKAKVAAGKHRVYRDRACIAGLERFLDHAARESLAI